MTNATITPVILCGGAGTRLWPLSRKSFPKQFVPLIGNKNLMQLTLERVVQLSSRVRLGAMLSSQINFYLAKHWIVVSGAALMTQGKEEFLPTENQPTYISIGETHRLENSGKTDFEMVEIQSGSYLGEDGIVRFEDTYGRVAIAASVVLTKL